MSTFWIRKRNFILGFIIGLIISILIALSIAYIFRSSVYAIAKREESEPAPVLNSILVLNKPIKKGEIIKEEDLKTINVELPLDKILTKEEIIGKKLRINLLENVPISEDFLGKALNFSNDDRLYEFSFIRLPFELNAGDFIDLRIRMHTGEDYVLISKKQLISYSKNTDDINSGLIELALNENELLSISSAFVDSYANELCEVYLSKYIDGENQRASSCNYPINEDVAELFKENPNIIMGGDIEESIKNRLTLDENLNKVIFENERLLSYDMSSKDNKEEDSKEEKSESQNQNSENPRSNQENSISDEERNTEENNESPNKEISANSDAVDNNENTNESANENTEKELNEIKSEETTVEEVEAKYESK